MLAYREWAREKQLHVPGTDGEFAVGAISGGAGAVSGGPLFLPRKEYIVEPPRHSTGHGPVELLRREEEQEEDKEGKKKRRSFGDIFRRKSKDVVGESRDAGKDGLDDK